MSAFTPRLRARLLSCLGVGIAAVACSGGDEPTKVPDTGAAGAAGAGGESAGAGGTACAPLSEPRECLTGAGRSVCEEVRCYYSNGAACLPRVPESPALFEKLSLSMAPPFNCDAVVEGPACSSTECCYVVGIGKCMYMGRPLLIGRLARLARLVDVADWS